MNKLDVSLPNTSWKVEGQAVKSAASGADGGESGQKLEAFAVFDDLLRHMSEKSEGMPARAQPPMIEAKSLLSPLGDIEDDSADQHGADDLLLKQEGDDGAPLLPMPEPHHAELQSGAALTGQPAPSHQIVIAVPAAPASRDKISAVSSSSLLDLIQLSADKTKVGEIPDDLANSSERRATVVHQEAHFKPVLLTDAPAQPKPKSVVSLQSFPMNAAGVGDGSAATAGSVQKDMALQEAPVLHASREGLRQAADTKGDKDPIEAPDAHVVTQRVVDAIQQETKRAPLEQPASTVRHDTSAPMFATKQSDGVLRMLDIQLRPVELGVITVKMRLSGDKLEMELHASREETAEILRKDSEMLSNLLRSSGYRPDMVSIHTSRTDMAQPDGLLDQRQSANPDGAGQFGGSHGGEASRNGRSQGEADEYRGGGQGGQKNGADEVAIANRSSGSLYL
ncbi:flagellar hook-length control protein FliK [Microvirga subterranea]|uniref:Flagellar hook-length control protein FliK n=1 Tax=Microvirga subterranea TaxID=186651 RepID=A0A370HCM1_9HYPH|nr:flagellar hook-length control protein FliK [Microvirga subterranea]RDI54828.1 flagellar hook-length control protein FliK [Microvirga subterranea]